MGRGDLEILEAALELFRDMLGPCDDDCECIIHPLQGLVGRKSSEIR